MNTPEHAMNFMLSAVELAPLLIGATLTVNEVGGLISTLR